MYFKSFSVRLNFALKKLFGPHSQKDSGSGAHSINWIGNRANYRMGLST